MKRKGALINAVIVVVTLLVSGTLYAISNANVYRCNHDNIQTAIECLIMRYHLGDEPIGQDKFLALLQSMAEEFNVSDDYINRFYFYHHINDDGTHDIIISSPVFDPLTHSR